MTRHTAAALALLLTGTLAAPAASAQSWVPYDDFSAALSPSKWAAEQSESFNAVMLESRRTVAGGQLRLEARSFGDNVSSTGLSTVRNAMVLTSGARKITGIRATVTMQGRSVGVCPTNLSPGSSQAVLSGSFFNAGSPRRGSAMNDVYAGIRLDRSASASAYSARAFVGICADERCETAVSLFESTLPWTFADGEAVPMWVAWDAAANQFKFDANGATFPPYTYTLPDAESASVPNKRIAVRNLVPQCAGVRVAGFVSADFDNVQVDGLSAVAQDPPDAQVASSEVVQ